jgi:hypothetical protein
MTFVKLGANSTGTHQGVLTPGALAEEGGMGSRRETLVGTNVGQNGMENNCRIKWCTYNIMHHGLGQLQQVLKSCDDMTMNFGILTEAKIKDEKYPQSYCGYKILATQASNDQGGVLPFHQDNSQVFSVESVRFHGPNVLSFYLVCGKIQWQIVGTYIPPSET